LGAPPARDYLPSPPAYSFLGFNAAFVRPGDSLPASSSSTHFKVHYDTTLNTAEDVSALLVNLEEAWAKLVQGGGGTPNAGLKAPLSDNGAGGDDKVDVYLTTSDTQCGSGASGCAMGEYFEITAQYATGSYSGSAMRGAHELTHVIQYAYEYVYGVATMVEAGASWGAFWVFPHEDNYYSYIGGWSLDCHNTSFAVCPYYQFSFIERQVENYGVSFVDTLFKQGSVGDRVGMRNAIALASGGSDTLSSRYASYERQLWEPNAWTSEQMRAHINNMTASPSSTYLTPTSVQLSRSSPDSGERQNPVDQLAARFVKLTPQSETAVAGDRVRISVGDPSAPGIGTPTDIVVADPSGGRSEVALSETCGTFRCATIPFDPASVSYVVIPLVNDNDPVTGANIDSLPFTWRAELLPAVRASFTVDSTSGQAPLTVHFTNTSQGATSYSWSFGDGSSSTAASPSYTFTAAGTYAVTLTASASGTSSQATKTIVVSAAPVASFTVDHASGPAPITFQFTNTSQGATSYSWSFGDGSSSTTASPSHTFTAAGTYTVTLTASASGSSSQATKTIVVLAAPPVASFTVSRTSGTAPLTVHFTNTSQRATSYSWSFGDGRSSTTASPSHVFTTPGAYTVTLTAFVYGTFSRVTKTIVVLAPPVASFTVSRTSGTAPLTVHFTNTSQRATSYSWSFGDGQSSTTVSPSHVFTTPGIYTVTLSATGPGGVVKKSVTINVLAPKPDLAVSLARKKSKRLGKLRLASFVVTLKNRGEAPDEQVKIKIALPTGVSFKSISFSGRKCTRKGRQAICSVEVLSTQKTVRLSFVAAAARRAKVQVSVSGKRVEKSLANNTARSATW
jgi:PKD repeat protein